MNTTTTITNTRPAGFIYKNELARAYGLTVRTLMKKVKAKGLDLGRSKYLYPGEIDQIVKLMGGEPNWEEVKPTKNKSQK